MIRRLSYIFLFFSVLAGSAASAKVRVSSQCMAGCANIGITNAICTELCTR